MIDGEALEADGITTRITVNMDLGQEIYLMAFGALTNQNVICINFYFRHGGLLRELIYKI
jgi:hypothetical protein